VYRISCRKLSIIGKRRTLSASSVFLAIFYLAL
jgi:hypothetical protein